MQQQCPAFKAGTLVRLTRLHAVFYLALKNVERYWQTWLCREVLVVFYIYEREYCTAWVFGFEA
jgi:hypothetical protein